MQNWSSATCVPFDLPQEGVAKLSWFEGEDDDDDDDDDDDWLLSTTS